MNIHPVNMYNALSGFLCVLVIGTGCNNGAEHDKNDKPSVTIKDSTAIIDTGTNNRNLLPVKDSSNAAVRDTTIKKGITSVKNWKPDDFIIHPKDRTNEALRRTVLYEKEQWENVKNPLTATYRGCDIGDYFHLNFEDANGKTYDFGNGNNNYGHYLLFTALNYITNPEYAGKTFRINWEWKVSRFACCDGDYNMVEAYFPSITKLELMATKTRRK